MCPRASARKHPYACADTRLPPTDGSSSPLSRPLSPAREPISSYARTAEYTTNAVVNGYVTIDTVRLRDRGSVSTRSPAATTKTSSGSGKRSARPPRNDLVTVSGRARTVPTLGREIDDRVTPFVRTTRRRGPVEVIFFSRTAGGASISNGYLLLHTRICVDRQPNRLDYDLFT